MSTTDTIIQVFKKHYKPGCIPEQHSYNVLVDAMELHADEQTAEQQEIIERQADEINKLKGKLFKMTDKYLELIERVKYRKRGRHVEKVKTETVNH